MVLGEVRADAVLDPALLVARRNDDGDERPGGAGRRRRGPRDTLDRQRIDGEENQAENRQRGRGDEGTVQETYDSGTFWRASARYGEFG